MNSEQRAEAKRIYLVNVNNGHPLKVAAVEAGVTMGAVRNWRSSDKAFAQAEQAFRMNDIENEDEEDGSYMPGMTEQEIHDMENEGRIGQPLTTDLAAYLQAKKAAEKAGQEKAGQGIHDMDNE